MISKYFIFCCICVLIVLISFYKTKENFNNSTKYYYIDFKQKSGNLESKY